MKTRVAIVGTGTIGAQAARVLAQRGHDVHCYDMEPPGHPLGAAGGEGRLMSSLHGQRSDYDALYARASHLWGALEREAKRPLRSILGRINIGSQDYVEQQYHHGLEIGEKYELLTPKDLKQNYPFQSFREDDYAVLDRTGGIVRSELAISSAARSATAAGATLHIGEPVRDISETSSYVTVATDSSREEFEHVIVTTGAWARQFFPAITKDVKVYRPVLAWFAPLHERALVNAVTFSRRDPHQFYGVPTLDGRLLRLGYGGPRQRPIEEAPQPSDYHVSTACYGEYPEIMNQYFPDFQPTPVRINAYFEGYIDGADPIIRRTGNITLGVGFSGNAFKFSPAYGELIADLATTGEVRQEGRFLVTSN